MWRAGGGGEGGEQGTYSVCGSDGNAAESRLAHVVRGCDAEQGTGSSQTESVTKAATRGTEEHACCTWHTERGRHTMSENTAKPRVAQH